MRQPLEEHGRGKFAGPWEVYLDEEGEVNSNVPFTQWLPTRRFARTQGNTQSSYKVRPIDDCTASGLNPGAAAVERMRMSGLEVLMDTVEYAAGKFHHLRPDGQIVLSKGDHKQAYRQ